MEMLRNGWKKATKSITETTTDTVVYERRRRWSRRRRRRRREQWVSHLVLRNMIEIMQCILPSG